MNQLKRKYLKQNQLETKKMSQNSYCETAWISPQDQLDDLENKVC